MEKVICIISLGSNTDAELNLTKAYNLLKRAYPDIHFSQIKKTAPRRMRHNTSFFFNQVAKFTTEQEEKEIITALKIMERFCGRCPEDKERETIHIDIDLLAYGNTTLKPDDFVQYSKEIEYL